MKDDKEPMFRASPDMLALYNIITAAKEGETIPYTAFNDAICRDVQNGATHILASARQRALHVDRIVTAAVANVGIKVLSDSEKVLTSHDGLARIRRLARRSGKKIAAVKEFDRLPNEQKIRHNAALSIFGAICQATGKKPVERIEAAVQDNMQQIPLNKTFELFRA